MDEHHEKCKGCGAKITFGPRSYHKKFCSKGCREKFYQVKENRANRQRRVTFLHRQISRYGPPPKIAMSSVDAAWLAGFWDGEGTISVTKKEPAGNKFNTTYLVRMRVGNTNQVLVDRVAQLLGADNISRNTPKPQKENHKPCHQVVVNSRSCEAALRCMHPYLIGKLPQANLALRFIEARDAAIIGKENTDMYDELCRASSALNHRGTE